MIALTVKTLGFLLGTLLALAAASAGAAPSAVLEQRMQWFRDGALRGFVIAELPDSGQEIYTETDFKDLAATGANLVRVAIQLRKCKGCDHYDMPEADVRYLVRILERGKRYGFRVVPVLIATPWGNQSDYWDNSNLKADIVRKWGQLARRVMFYPALQAYDLINEPVVPAAVPGDSAPRRWLELAEAIARELRAVDPDTPLMVEPTPWALPHTFAVMPPLKPMPGIVYSFHLYAPHSFTHQGLPGHADVQAYPGNGWDRSRLRQEMLEARRFAAQHQVPMFVGEFSCVRWAPAGACQRYLSDAIGLFEAERWGWAYHCWRCYQGWDAEVPAEVAAELPAAQAAGLLPAERRADSKSLLLLKNALRRNGEQALKR